MTLLGVLPIARKHPRSNALPSKRRFSLFFDCLAHWLDISGRLMGSWQTHDNVWAVNRLPSVTSMELGAGETVSLSQPPFSRCVDVNKIYDIQHIILSIFNQCRFACCECYIDFSFNHLRAPMPRLFLDMLTFLKNNENKKQNKQKLTQK